MSKRINIVKEKLDWYLSQSHSDINKVSKGQFVLISFNDNETTAKVIPTTRKAEATFIADTLGLIHGLQYNNNYPGYLIYGKVTAKGNHYVVSNSIHHRYFTIPLENGNILIDRKYFRNYVNSKSTK